MAPKGLTRLATAKSKRKLKLKPLSVDASSQHPSAPAGATLQPQPPVAAAEPGTAECAERGSDPSPNPGAEPDAGSGPGSGTGSTTAPCDQPPAKACVVCQLQLPPQAKFCCGCGEPQVAGLERPVYRVVPQASSAPSNPPLSADPPTPPSPLQPDSVPGPSSGFSEPEPTAKPAVAVGASPLSNTSAVEPLFDRATEARVLALRTSHELTVEHFDRLMMGFRLKPKPRVAMAKSKAPPKDKDEKKSKDKPAKGH